MTRPFARLRFFSRARAAALVGLPLAVSLSGCVGKADRQPAPRDLPALLDGGWTAPASSARVIAGERSSVLDAAVAAANSLGYSVRRLDGARGRVIGSRREGSAFDGLRERTLEVVVTELAPGSVEVRVVIRETAEDSAGRVSGGVVRDRAAYEAFFVRLAESSPPN